MSDPLLTEQIPTAWPLEVATAALEASEEFIFVVDQADCIVHLNESAASALELPRLGTTSQPWRAILDPGSQTKSDLLLADVRVHRRTEPYELNLVARSGEAVSVVVRAQLVNVPNAAQPFVLVTGRSLLPTINVTEHLVALNRRLNALFAIIATAGQSLRLRTMLEQVLAVTCAEWEARAAAVLLSPLAGEPPSGADAITSPADLTVAATYNVTQAAVDRVRLDPAVQARWFELKATRKPLIIDNIVAPTNQLARPSLGAAGLLSLAVVPLWSEHQLLGVIVVVSDRYRLFQADDLDVLAIIGQLLVKPIENARLYEERLETLAQLETVLDGIASGVVLIDSQGTILLANVRLGELLRVDVSGWPGQVHAAILPPLVAPHDRSATGLSVELVSPVKAPERVLQCSRGPVHDRAGVVLGTIEVYNDVTELESLSRLKDDFVAAAAHDLKTPITAIKGYAQIGLRLAERQNQPRFVQQLTMINQRSDELTYLIDSLLDMSRLQAGHLVLDLAPFSIGSLVDHVVAHFGLELQRRNGNLRVAMERDLIVTWDESRMTRVLMNLIGNAIKYSPDLAPIDLLIHATADGREVEMAVTDHGIGIPEEERRRVFERFYRVPAVVKHGYKGTGLGLYICQRIVEHHGGRTRVEDARHGGEGTSLVVVMPRICGAEEQA